jgi:hypothetical protein
MVIFFKGKAAIRTCCSIGQSGLSADLGGSAASGQKARTAAARTALTGRSRQGPSPQRGFIEPAIRASRSIYM